LRRISNFQFVVVSSVIKLNALALEDLTRAADLFRPIWDRTRGVDGWVSLEVSRLLAHDTLGGPEIRACFDSARG